jgi:hypothetical protein
MRAHLFSNARYGGRPMPTGLAHDSTLGSTDTRRYAHATVCPSALPRGSKVVLISLGLLLLLAGCATPPQVVARIVCAYEQKTKFPCIRYLRFRGVDFPIEASSHLHRANDGQRNDLADYLLAKQQLELYKAERDVLAQNLRLKHPDMIDIEQKISLQQSLVEDYRKQSVERLKTRRDSEYYTPKAPAS